MQYMVIYETVVLRPIYQVLVETENIVSTVVVMSAYASGNFYVKTKTYIQTQEIRETVLSLLIMI